MRQGDVSCSGSKPPSWDKIEETTAVMHVMVVMLSIVSRNPRGKEK